MTTCPFCGNNRKEFLLSHGYDVKRMYFYESTDYSISPDLSPLVDGHLLAIPSKHYASFGELPDRRLFEEIISKGRQLLGTSDLLVFEHGAVVAGEGGASIDHAHLHIMPRPHSISTELIDRYIVESGYVDAGKQIGGQELLHSFYLNTQPYIFYQIYEHQYAYPVAHLPHQFLRLMLQPYCQLSYNWRETFSTKECKENVEKTIQYVDDHKMN